MKIENRQQWLIALTVMCASLLLGDRLLFTPLVTFWKARSARIADLQKKIGDGTLLVQRERGLRMRWDDMQSNTLSKVASAAEQQLLKSFDSWSRDSGVNVTGITPQWKRGADGDFMTLECRVDVSGNLEKLTRLLYNIEKDEMALKVEALELSARDAAGQDLIMGLRVSGLVLGSTEQQP